MTRLRNALLFGLACGCLPAWAQAQAEPPVPVPVPVPESETESESETEAVSETETVSESETASAPAPVPAPAPARRPPPAGDPWHEAERKGTQEPREERQGIVSGRPRTNNAKLHATIGAGFGARFAGFEGGGDPTNAAPRYKLSYLHPIVPVLALGATLHHAVHESDWDELLRTGDSTLHGVSLAVELRAPNRTNVVPYVRLGAGPMLSTLATDRESSGFREDADRALGVHLELGTGIQVIMLRHFGISLGLSLDSELFSHELTLTPTDGSPASRYDLGFGMLTAGVEAGVVVPF